MCDPEAAEPNAKKINKKTEVFVFWGFFKGQEII